VNAITPGHLAIIAVVVIVLFGAKKLPDAARSLGKSMRIFKSEIREMNGENKPETSAIETPAAPSANPTPVQAERVDPPAGPEQGHTEARRA
jgi:sec-independent protein translocase protein TatA